MSRSTSWRESSSLTLLAACTLNWDSAQAVDERFGALCLVYSQIGVTGTFEKASDWSTLRRVRWLSTEHPTCCKCP